MNLKLVTHVRKLKDKINGTYSKQQTAGLVGDKAAQTARSATATRRECLITTLSK